MKDMTPAHQAYHVDVDYDEDGNRIGVLIANPDCPYCQEEDQAKAEESAQQQTSHEGWGPKEDGEE